MSDFFGNLATAIGGVGGMLVGFALFAIVFAVALVPFLFWMRNPDRRTRRRTGLERFAASLDTPDEGYKDRLAADVTAGESVQSEEDDERIRNQGVIRSTASRPRNEFPAPGR